MARQARTDLVPSKWAAKQEKFQPREKFFSLTSTCSEKYSFYAAFLLKRDRVA